MKKYEAPKLEEIVIKIENIMYESVGDDTVIRWNLLHETGIVD